MNLTRFREAEANATAIAVWCSYVIRHPGDFSSQDMDEAFFWGRWFWTSHVIHETPMIGSSQAEAIVGYLGTVYQVRKCPLSATAEVWGKVYADDPKRDLEFQAGDFLSIEAAMDAAQVMYHEARQGSVVRESMAMAA